MHNSIKFLRQLALVAVATLGLLSGCASDKTRVNPANAAVAPAAANETYRIGPDDRVQVSVWRNDDLSISVPVRPDGMISVPLVGDVLAGGKTPEEVAKLITDKMAVFIRDPRVAVIVTELHSHEYLSRVRITGAVRTPRTMPFRQGMTVLDAVLEAGGVNEFAAPSRTKLYRKASGKVQTMDVELDAILNSGELDTNALLSPGDVITVPERVF